MEKTRAIVVGTLICCCLLIAGCGLAEPASDTQVQRQDETTVGPETAFTEALGMDVVDVVFKETDTYVVATAVTFNQDWDRSALFRALTAVQAFTDEEHVVRVGVTYPQPDGTGAYLWLTWNPWNRTLPSDPGELEPLGIAVEQGHRQNLSGEGVLQYIEQTAFFANMTSEVLTEIGAGRSAIPELGDLPERNPLETPAL